MARTRQRLHYALCANLFNPAQALMALSLYTAQPLDHQIYEKERVHDLGLECSLGLLFVMPGSKHAWTSRANPTSAGGVIGIVIAVHGGALGTSNAILRSSTKASHLIPSYVHDSLNNVGLPIWATGLAGFIAAPLLLLGGPSFDPILIILSAVVPICIWRHWGAVTSFSMHIAAPRLLVLRPPCLPLVNSKLAIVGIHWAGRRRNRNGLRRRAACRSRGDNWARRAACRGRRGQSRRGAHARVVQATPPSLSDEHCLYRAVGRGACRRCWRWRRCWGKGA